MKPLLGKTGLSYSVKERIFLYYMLFFTVLSFLTILCNLAYGIDFSFNYKWMATGLFSCCLMVLAVKKVWVEQLHRIGTYGIVLVLLPVSALNSSGLISPGIIYTFLVLILINYLLQGWDRIFLNSAAILINMALIVLFRFHPENFKPMTAHEQFMDWIINVPVVSIFTIVLLVTFEKAYEAERKRNEEQSEILKQLSRIDPLTGLYNRSHMETQLSRHHDIYIRTQAPYSVIMIDIDYFKAYNDFYGHLKGDQCLKTVADLLKRRISRKTDWACRFGGEEFLILLGFSDTAGAAVVAREIQKDLAALAIPHEGSKVDSTLTVSMGIASVCHLDQTPESLIEAADKALYCSKAQGRNRITRDSGMDPGREL